MNGFYVKKFTLTIISFVSLMYPAMKNGPGGAKYVFDVNYFQVEEHFKSKRLHVFFKCLHLLGSRVIWAPSSVLKRNDKR